MAERTRQRSTARRLVNMVEDMLGTVGREGPGQETAVSFSETEIHDADIRRRSRRGPRALAPCVEHPPLG